MQATLPYFNKLSTISAVSGFLFEAQNLLSCQSLNSHVRLSQKKPFVFSRTGDLQRGQFPSGSLAVVFASGKSVLNSGFGALLFSTRDVTNA